MEVYFSEIQQRIRSVETEKEHPLSTIPAKNVWRHEELLFIKTLIQCSRVTDQILKEGKQNWLGLVKTGMFWAN